MSFFETIGMAWVILTSSLATVGIFYFAIRGAKRFAEDSKNGGKLNAEELERLAAR